MPDGSIAECYAKTVAERVVKAFYPQGFEHHYWNPQKLVEPSQLKKPSRIFLDSMSDLMGSWIPEEQIKAVLDICRQSPKHHFQLLTKNAPQLLKFKDILPPNVWVGVSAPPSFMFGKPLSLDQQHRMVERQLDVLRQLPSPIKWMSIEPLSFDIAPLLTNSGLQWIVVGAASNGNITYQPERVWLDNLLNEMDRQGIKVFFKGNLSKDLVDRWREEMPE